MHSSLVGIGRSLKGHVSILERKILNNLIQKMRNPTDEFEKTNS